MVFHYWRSCLFSSCLRHFECHLVYLPARSRIITSTMWGQWLFSVAKTWKISRDGDSATWFTEQLQCWVNFLMKDLFLIPNLNFPHQHLLPIPSLCCHCHCQVVLICHDPQSGCRIFLLCPLLATWKSSALSPSDPLDSSLLDPGTGSILNYGRQNTWRQHFTRKILTSVQGIWISLYLHTFLHVWIWLSAVRAHWLTKLCIKWSPQASFM